MKKLSRKVIALLMTAAMCMSMLPSGYATEAAAEEASAAEQFVIMSTTDVHGKVWNKNILNDTNVNNSLLNVSTAVTEYREKYGKDQVIVLDNGDLYQGTPISSYNINQYTKGETDKINPMAVALSYIGYDAATLGNHEFNYPWKTMQAIYKYQEDNGVAGICANLYYEETGKRVFSPYILKKMKVGGQEITVGIIGIENTDCTRWDVPDNYPGIIFASPENKDLDVAYEVEKVQKEWADANIDPDFVVLCYHAGLGSDSDTLTYGTNTENQVLRTITRTSGIDMVVAGHDHSTSYSNNTYKNKNGEDVLVVNAGGSALTSSVWNVSVDGAGKPAITLSSSENLNLSNYAVDEKLQELIQPYADTAIEYVNTSVGALKNWDGKTNSGNRYYLEQTDTMDLINRTQIVQGGVYLNQKYASVDALNARLREIYGADTTKQLKSDALVNGKLVVDLSSTSVVTSSPIPAAGDSELSMKGIYGFYKYDNSLYLITLTGAEIKEFLEYNASKKIDVKIKNGEVTYSGGDFTFPVFYGLNYELDMSRPDGDRAVISGFSNGKAFNLDETYIFAINNYHLGNVENDVMGKYSTTDAIWSQTDDLGGGYVQDLIAEYVEALTKAYGGVYGTKDAEKNGEAAGTWAITYSAEIPKDVVVSDNTAYVGEQAAALNDGDQIMIYNAGNAVSIASDYYNEKTLKALEGTTDNSKLYAQAGTAIFTVGVTEDGCYTFRTDAGYLTAGATGNSVVYQEEANEYSLWIPEETGEAGVCYLKNANAAYNGNAQYLEYYRDKFTTYGLSAGGAAYTISFYQMKTTGVEASGEELADGDNIVIYYTTGETVLGGANGTKLAAVGASQTATESGRTLVVPEAGAAIFQVGKTEEGYYTFSTDEGYLTAGASGNSLSLSETVSGANLSYWELEPTEDGNYNIHNVGANYNGSYNQYLEYYYGFTTYGMSSSRPELYKFKLYKIGAVANAPVEEEVTGYRLPVFETSDVHGYLLDTSSGSADTYQYRLAYIADKVNDARAVTEEDEVLLLDGGDIYQGNVISNLQNGQPMTAAYDLMDYDAVAIGNHEFDWGYEAVIDADGTMGSYAVGSYKGDSEVPVVTSNLYQDDEQVTFAKPYVILEKTAIDEEGNLMQVKVGVIGFVDDYAADIMAAQFTGRGFAAKEDYEALEQLAAALENDMGCDATIALCHADAAGVANSLSKDTVIDLVCGGHSHSAQSGTSASGIAYIQPSNQAATYGYAELVFRTEEKDGAVSVSGVKTVSQKTVSVTGDKTKLYDTEDNAADLDADIVALSKASVENVSDVLEETLGYITTGATKASVGSGSSSTAGNWLSSLMARAVGADVAFTNNGGIRTEFALSEDSEYRNITAGDIYTISPFCNAIYCYEVTYAELLEVLNYSLGSGSSLGLRMSGIDCYYSGKAVTALVLSDGTLIYDNGEWKDGYDAKTVKVATNEYVATSDTPFKNWNDTEKLLSNNTVDNEGTIWALKQEAEESRGYLYVDPNPHMISGAYDAEAVEPHVHDYTFSKVTEATCTDGGYTIHVCEACGDYYFTDETDALGHVDADEDGVCDVCGADLTPEVMLGDVDGDKEITATDALLVLRIVVKLDTADARQTIAADVTRNGSIEALDALMILKYVVNLVAAF